MSAGDVASLAGIAILLSGGTDYYLFAFVGSAFLPVESMMNQYSPLVVSLLKVALVILALSYVLMAVVLFSHWLKALYQDPMMDTEEMFVSKTMLAIATLFRPLVIPLCYLELSAKF